MDRFTLELPALISMIDESGKQRANLEKMGGQRSRIDVSGSVIRTESQGMAVCFDKKYNISPING